MRDAIHHDDAFHVLGTLPAGCVQCCFVDPPYNFGIDYGNGAKDDLMEPEQYLQRMDFLITATLEGILAQRLVRRICVECRQPYDPTDKELYEVELTRTDVADKQFFFGKGCKKCNGTGYKGRIALFEILVATDRVKDLIMNSASTANLREAAREEGMRTLRDGGLLHIYDGVTTIEEVVRETMSSI